MHFEGSQSSAFDTPLPIYRTSSDDALTEKPLDIVSSFIRIFKDQGVKLDANAAKLLAEQSTDNNVFLDSVVDTFYAAVKATNVDHVTVSIARKLLAGSVAPPVSTRILNCFTDFPHYTWDAAQQKFARSAPREGSHALLPDVSTLCSAARQRYYRAIHRLKVCPNVVWWSETQVLQRMALTAEERLVVRPAECTKGVSGTVSVVGVLRAELEDATDEYAWFLEDDGQRLPLDVTQCDTRGQLFLMSNVVVVTGEIDPVTGVLHGKELGHPPIEDDADGDVADILWKKRSSATPMATLGSGCSSSQNLWLVFGVCHLDNATVLSNIYTALCRHDNVTGILLTGEFHSKPRFRPSSTNQYVEGFGELLDAIKLWKEERLKLNKAPQKALRVVLIPALYDTGPRFLPKLPLLEMLVMGPHAQDLAELKDYAQLTFGSNPLRLEATINSNPAPQLDTSPKRSVIVCRADLIRDIDQFRLALRVPFEQPLYPTAEELIHTVPNLLAGQAHVYPVPFRTPHVVRIAPGYDFCLEMPSLPDMIIFSDSTVAYTTWWEERSWFGCPGLIADGSYLSIDLYSNIMRQHDLPVHPERP